MPSTPKPNNRVTPLMSRKKSNFPVIVHSLKMIDLGTVYRQSQKSII